MKYQVKTFIVLKSGKCTQVTNVFDDVYELANGEYATDADVYRIDEIRTIEEILNHYR